MWFQFNALQWGQSLQTINVDGSKAADANLSPVTGMGTNKSISGTGGVSKRTSSSRGGGVGGSGG